MPRTYKPPGEFVATHYDTTGRADRGYVSLCKMDPSDQKIRSETTAHNMTGIDDRQPQSHETSVLLCSLKLCFEVNGDVSKRKKRKRKGKNEKNDGSEKSTLMLSVERATWSWLCQFGA